MLLNFETRIPSSICLLTNWMFDTSCFYSAHYYTPLYWNSFLFFSFFNKKKGTRENEQASLWPLPHPIVANVLRSYKMLDHYSVPRASYLQHPISISARSLESSWANRTNTHYGHTHYPPRDTRRGIMWLTRNSPASPKTITFEINSIADCSICLCARQKVHTQKKNHLRCHEIINLVSSMHDWYDIITPAVNNTPPNRPAHSHLRLSQRAAQRASGHD